MQEEELRVAVFAPHPDDDIIGCGGAMRLHALAGHRVTVVYLTSGGAGSLSCRGDELAARREAEATAAAGRLGAEKQVFLRCPDGGLQDDTALLTRLVALLRELRPHVVYLPHAGDEPRDHRATHALVSEAVRRAAGPWFAECGDQPWRVQTVLGYEVWTPLPRAGFVLDISAVMADKLEALRMHVSQVSGVAYHQAVAGLNRYRGGMTGRGEYCECFEVVLASRLW